MDGHESAILPSEGGGRANEIIIEEEVRKISKIKQESSEKEKYKRKERATFAWIYCYHCQRKKNLRPTRLDIEITDDSCNNLE